MRIRNPWQYICIITSILLMSSCSFQEQLSENSVNESTEIIPAAERVTEYLPLLGDKRIAIVANQTSLIGKSHIVDSLLKLHVRIVKIFSPEHGFRGTYDAGMAYNNHYDSITGLEVVSLYGNYKKPSSEDLDSIDLVIFDIQDVGVRFYTYTSTMSYVMEACAEKGIPMLILDRPNPNGHYVDGPVLEMKYKSFVGLHPVALVHGLTIAEYARMINGEYWLKDSLQCDIQWVLCKNYSHQSQYELPINPSPNLRNMRSIYLYPSLGLFEGTDMSVGRGTQFPFQIFGHPKLKNASYRFIPQSKPGEALNPKFMDNVCHGYNLSELSLDSLKNIHHLQLEYLITAYQGFPEKDKFFNNFFELLAGTRSLREQIQKGMNEEQIRESWNPSLNEYKTIRQKYLLYENSNE